MPSGKYYCDYCEKEFQDTQVARKRHLQSKPHLRAKALWYSSSSSGISLLSFFSLFLKGTIFNISVSFNTKFLDLVNPQVSNFATKGLCNRFITSVRRIDFVSLCSSFLAISGCVKSCPFRLYSGGITHFTLLCLILQKNSLHMCVCM